MSGGALSGTAGATSSPALDTTAMGLKSLTDTVCALRAELDSLSNNKDSTYISFGGISAKGPEDTKEWVTLNHPSGEWDILSCVDPLILFGLLESHARVESSAGLKEFEQHQKLSLKNPGKAMAVTATSLQRPQVFHKGEPTLVCQRDGLPLLKLAKHSDWDSDGNGLRFSVQAKLGAKIVGAMQSQILGR